MSLIGFSDFNEVHKMFTLSDFRMTFAFVGAVMLLAVGFVVFDHRKQTPRKKFNKGTISGSFIFGAGWAITGSCPIIAMIQLGEGQLAAVFVIIRYYWLRYRCLRRVINNLVPTQERGNKIKNKTPKFITL